MESDQFFYWLQGYFELSGTTAPLSADQGDCIRRHIDLVSAADLTRTLPERIVEIRMLLEMLHTDPQEMTSKIRTRISDEFVRVIDPKAGPAAQANLNHLHSSTPGKPGVFRC